MARRQTLLFTEEDRIQVGDVGQRHSLARSGVQQIDSDSTT